MEITKENIDEVKILDQKVNHLLEQCRPTTVLSLIREGKNPLDMPIDELNRELERINEENGVTKEEFLAHIGKYGTNVHVQQDEVFEYFLSILQTAIDLRDEQNTNLSSKTLKKALAYIDEHYTSENLSLGTVACEVQVGANYLSSVFSQNMQKTFTEYISEKRMEKAKKLLKSTELPTSEIAAQVGYKDPHYFSFVFKKTQGCSPREYRSGI